MPEARIRDNRGCGPARRCRDDTGCLVNPGSARTACRMRPDGRGRPAFAVARAADTAASVPGSGPGRASDRFWVAGPGIGDRDPCAWREPAGPRGTAHPGRPGGQGPELHPAGILSLAVLFGNDHYIGLVVVMLLCLACLAILAGVPRVRMFFTGPEAPHAGEGISVTVARTLLAAFACLCILLGVAFLPAGDLGGQWVLAGIILIAIGITVFVLNSHLARGEPMARLITTGLLVVYAILELITSGRDPASLLPLAMAAGIAGLLWLPPDAQRHFGQPRMAAEV